MTSVPSHGAHRFRILPTTHYGRLACRFAIAGVAAMLVTPLVALIPWVRYVATPLGYSLAFAGAVLGGVFALIAIIRDKERAVGVFAATVPLALYFVLIVAEVVVGGQH
jgi:hypothetical protein